MTKAPRLFVLAMGFLGLAGGPGGDRRILSAGSTTRLGFGIGDSLSTISRWEVNPTAEREATSLRKPGRPMRALSVGASATSAVGMAARTLLNSIHPRDVEFVQASRHVEEAPTKLVPDSRLHPFA